MARHRVIAVLIPFMDERRHPAVAFFFSLMCFQDQPLRSNGIRNHRDAGMA
jgi:hypothetical protein